MRPICGALLVVGFAAVARPAAAQPASELPTQLGPVVVRSEDGAFSFRPQLLSQLRSTIRALEDGASDPGDATVFDLHRLRTGMQLGFRDWVTVALQLDLAPRSPELIDAWVELRPDPGVRIRAGQMKVPFTRYWEQSIAGLGMVDWPIAVRHFGGEHQLGLMVHDTGRSGAGLEYAVGVFGGENRRGAHARELPALYGESHGNPSSLGDPRAPGVVHPEVVGRVTHRSAGIPASTVMPTDLVSEPDGEIRHAVSLSAAWDAAPERGRDFAFRVAPEARLEGPGVSVTAVGYAGFVPTANEPFEPGMVGAMLEAAWRPHRHIELALRFARVAMLPGLREDTYADDCAPEAPADLPACREQFSELGPISARQELGLGLSVPIFGRSLVWQSDVTWLRTEQLAGAHDHVRVRSQLQLAL